MAQNPAAEASCIASSDTAGIGGGNEKGEGFFPATKGTKAAAGQGGEGTTKPA